MSEQERPNKGIQDFITGELQIVPVTDEEWDEIKAKQVRVQVEQAAETAAEESAKAVIDARPTDDATNSAKTIAELKELMLKQNALIDLLLKKLGLIS